MTSHAMDSTNPSSVDASPEPFSLPPPREDAPDYHHGVIVGSPATLAPLPPPPAPVVQPPVAKPQTPKKRFGLGWALRRVVALGFVGVALWWLVVPLLFPVTSQAVVNARLVQVRAPIDGSVTEQRCEIGETVALHQPLMHFKNPRVDTTHLGTLTTKEADLKAQRKRLTAELEEAVRNEKSWRESAEQFRQGRRTMLEAAIKEAKASLDMARHQHEAARKSHERLKSLASREAGVANELDLAQEQESVARKRIEREEATLSKAQTELKAAEQGIILQQETPYCLVRLDEMTTKVQTLQSSLYETDEKLAAVTAELTGEQERLARLMATTAAAPVNGVVWTRQGNLGQVVKQNEVVYEVADSSTIFVEALMHQRHLSCVQPGSTATIVVTGGETFTGRVRAIRTPGPADCEPSFALRLPQHDLNQVRVVIEFDAGPNNAKLIGRHARVLLTDETPGPMHGCLAWMFSCVGG